MHVVWYVGIAHKINTLTYIISCVQSCSHHFIARGLNGREKMNNILQPEGGEGTFANAPLPALNNPCLPTTQSACCIMYSMYCAQDIYFDIYLLVCI